MLVVGLVEEDILPVVPLPIDGLLLKDTISINGVFFAQLLPELLPDYSYSMEYFGFRTGQPE